MSRVRKGRPIHGWLAIDKGPGMTSTEVVNQVKRLTQAQKVGHGGTLDPLATGILPVALGEATKTVPYVMGAPKSYVFTLRFGEARDTDDAEGRVVATSQRRPSDTEIEAALEAGLVGLQQLEVAGAGRPVLFVRPQRPHYHRALAIAASPPMGPVYLSLPREVLCTPAPALLEPTPCQVPAAPTLPTAEAIDEAAAWLARAERPLVVAQRSGREAAGMAALVRLAEVAALPVVEHWPVRISFPADHPLHAGFDPHPLLREADLVLTVDAPVPWLPARATPPAGCRVIALGADPLQARIPVRGFPADLVLAGEPTGTLEALADAVAERLRGSEERLARRRAAIARHHAAWREAARELATRGSGTPMSAAWVGRCLGEAIGAEGVVFAELGVDPAQLGRSWPGSWFSHALSGGLGWALPAALGAQLADRERLVVATVGDGSYLFANPVACHQIAAALRLPVLTIVLDNGTWNAVRKSTLAVYPDGHAARANRMPLTSLEPRPDHAAVCAACGGWGRRVRDGAALPGALAEALRVVREERRQALLQVEVAA